MDKVFRVETTLSQELAELYGALVDEFETKSSIPLSEMNQAILQTGLIHHLTMMICLGLIEPPRAAEIEALLDRVARNTILWELLQVVRRYWSDCASGKGGSVDFRA